jgi:hypothetical protein
MLSKLIARNKLRRPYATSSAIKSEAGVAVAKGMAVAVGAAKRRCEMCLNWGFAVVVDDCCEAAGGCHRLQVALRLHRKP